MGGLAYNFGCLGTVPQPNPYQPKQNKGERLGPKVCLVLVTWGGMVWGLVVMFRNT